MAAFSAMDSSTIPSAYTLNKQDNSLTKSLPAFLDGTMKMLRRQWTAS